MEEKFEKIQEYFNYQGNPKSTSSLIKLLIKFDLGDTEYIQKKDLILLDSYFSNQNDLEEIMFWFYMSGIIKSN